MHMCLCVCMVIHMCVFVLLFVSSSLQFGYLLQFSIVVWKQADYCLTEGTIGDGESVYEKLQYMRIIVYEFYSD